jgi:hypothetical protein
MSPATTIIGMKLERSISAWETRLGKGTLTPRSSSESKKKAARQAGSTVCARRALNQYVT